MSSDLTIRPAFKEDAVKIATLSRELGYNISVERTIANLDIIERNVFDMVFVAVIRNEITGWIQASHVTRLETGTFCEITGLIVGERHRGNGIGRKLINNVVKWSKNHNCSIIRVSSNTFRNEAHVFYERLGFTSLKEQKVFELPVG